MQNSSYAVREGGQIVLRPTEPVRPLQSWGHDDLPRGRQRRRQLARYCIDIEHPQRNEDPQNQPRNPQRYRLNQQNPLRLLKTKETQRHEKPITELARLPISPALLLHQGRPGQNIQIVLQPIQNPSPKQQNLNRIPGSVQLKSHHVGRPTAIVLRENALHGCQLRILQAANLIFPGLRRVRQVESWKTGIDQFQ